jgi:hypothetical protein
MIAIDVRYGLGPITFCISNGAGQGRLLRALVWAFRVRVAPNDGGSPGQRPHEMSVTWAGRDEALEWKFLEENYWIGVRRRADRELFPWEV